MKKIHFVIIAIAAVGFLLVNGYINNIPPENVGENVGRSLVVIFGLYLGYWATRKPDEQSVEEEN